MFGTVKRLLIGLAVALAILGGSSLAPHGAAASQPAPQSDSGDSGPICYFDIHLVKFVCHTFSGSALPETGAAAQ